MIRNSYKYFFVQIILYFTVINFATAQNNLPTHDYILNLEKIKTPNPLLNQTINCIYKDSIGFVWIGTNNGLYKYDGNYYKVFRKQDHDTTSIASNKIISIYEDIHYNLCVTSNVNNIYCIYNYKYENFTRFNTNPNSIVYPLPIPLNKKYAKYLCTKENIYKYNLHNCKFEKIKLNTDFDILDINSYIEDKEGKLWIGSFTIGLLKYDALSNTLIRFYSSEKLHDYLSNCRILTMHYSNNGNIWIGGLRNEINCFNPKTEKYSSTWKNDNTTCDIEITVNSICEDTFGNIWMATKNGINIYNNNTNNFTILRPNPLYPQSLTTNNIQFLYTENSGKIWIVTAEGYIYIYDSNSIIFNDLIPDINTSKNLQNKSFKTAYKDSKGVLWIGTDWGLNMVSKTGKILKTYTHSKYNSNSIGVGGVCSIHEDKKGQLWIGTWGGGLNLFNTKYETFTRYGFIENDSNNPHSIGDVNILSIGEDMNGMLWLGTAVGIVDVFNPNNGTFKHINLNTENIRDVLIDNKNNAVWCCSSNGLFRVNISNYEIKKYSTNELNTNSISDNYTTNVINDFDGNLWITTLNGLNKFDVKKNQFVRINRINNITFDNLYGIQIDSRGDLWFTNSVYLLKLNPKTNKLRYYNESDGVIQNIKYSSQLNSGELVFGGSEGVNLIKPNDIKINNWTPKLVVTDFKVFNNSVKWKDKSYLINSIEQTKEIYLSYKDAIFSFDFSVLNYTKHNKCKFAYNLEGYDTSWNYIDDVRTASFSNIPPGSYKFNVKASNTEGYWGNNMVSIKVHISPPFWNTIWFKLLIIAIILLSVYLFIRFKTYTLKKRNVRLEQIVKYRTQHLQEANAKLEAQKLEIEEITAKVHEADQKRIRFLINISHEFRTPLTLIINPIEELLAKISENKYLTAMLHTIALNAQSLLNIINQVLDMRKLETNNMELEVAEHDIHLFIQSIFESFYQLAKKQNIVFNFNGSIKNNKGWFDKLKLERVVINLLSNAFKFTEKNGVIDLIAELSDNNELLKIKVSDSGIGIPNDKLNRIFDLYYQEKNSKYSVEYGTGIGLSLVKELVSLHNGEIEVTSKINSGSCFTVTIPIIRENYKEVNIANFIPIKNVEPNIEQQNIIPDTLISNDKNTPKNAPLVLIVEDSNDLRMFLKQNLQTFYNIILAQDGLIGYELACKKIPALIVSDILMPNMNGFELCTKIKNNEDICHIPVILLTSQLEIENELQGWAIKADDYVTKPFIISVLKARIDSIIKNRELLRNCFAKDYKISPAEIAITPLDKIFIDKAISLIELNIANEVYDVEAFSSDMALSKRQIFNKLKALTNLTPGEFIRSIRLKRAAQLILQSGLSISEIAFNVGFNNSNYFSTAFKKQFGVSPSEFIDNKQNP